MVLKIKINIVDNKNEQKKGISIVDNIFHFTIKEQDAYAATKLAISIIEFVSCYEDKEVLLLSEGLNKDFYIRLIFQLEIYNSVKKDEDKFILKYEVDYDISHKRLDIIKEIFSHYYETVRLPANIITCDELVIRFRSLIAKYGLTHNTKITEIIVDQESELRAIYAVGKASCYRPRLLIIEFFESYIEDYEYTVGMVTKGIIYDTGGLSIKPTDNMVGMQCDMGGSALGFYSALCYFLIYRKPILYVSSIAENAIGSAAYRPGDIVTSYSGLRIYVANTDAEGRIVLADGISYVTKNYKIKHLITYATLTGAARVVCGRDYCPYVAVEGEVNDIINSIKKEVGEYLIALPNEKMFIEGYENAASDYADLCNVTNTRGEGASHGPAQFLSRFIWKGIKINYTHFDIANYFDTGITKKRRSSADLLEFSILFIEKLQECLLI